MAATPFAISYYGEILEFFPDFSGEDRGKQEGYLVADNSLAGFVWFEI